MIQISEQNCCGCSACANICPRHAISMKRDHKGFQYPEINFDLCVNCGKCEQICPFHNQFSISQNKKPLTQYIARSKNAETLRASSSGGLFTELSDEILRSGGVVYGAGFDSESRIIHQRAQNVEQRNRLRGSKYVQSDMACSFGELADDLNAGGTVLFSGTPCQTAAVYSYCKMKHICMDNLFLCDVICHGVTSPMVWEKYVSFIKKNYCGDEIQSVNFRDKAFGSGYNMTIKGSKGVYHKDDTIDPFIRIFTRNYAMRLSCNNCPMKKEDRMSDITIGDFQNERKYFPEYDDGKGISVVLINTEKGHSLFQAIHNRLDYKLCSFEQAKQINLYAQIPPSPKSAAFYQDVEKKSFERVLRKYTEQGLLNHIYGSSKRLAKKVIYGVLKK